YWRGCIALRDGRYVEAQAAFRAALAASPDDPRFLYGLVAALSKGRSSRAPELDALVARLDARASTADQMDAVAEDRPESGHIAGAAAVVERALASDPGYWRSLAAEARVLFESGKVDAAIESQRKAIA